MAQTNDRLDRLVLEARRSAETREQGYRAQALKLFPWVCGRCARTFDHANLQLLEVHHKNNNHHDNPSDGHNWELLCTYCHENEHSKVKDSQGRSDSGITVSAATFNPFADLKTMLASKKVVSKPRLGSPRLRSAKVQILSSLRNDQAHRPLVLADHAGHCGQRQKS